MDRGGILTSVNQPAAAFLLLLCNKRSSLGWAEAWAEIAGHLHAIYLSSVMSQRVGSCLCGILGTGLLEQAGKEQHRWKSTETTFQTAAVPKIVYKWFSSCIIKYNMVLHFYPRVLAENTTGVKMYCFLLHIWISQKKYSDDDL